MRLSLDCMRLIASAWLAFMCGDWLDAVTWSHAPSWSLICGAAALIFGISLIIHREEQGAYDARPLEA